MYEQMTVTVAELRTLFHRPDMEIEIDTPDGWQPITSWWDKGILPMVTVTTENGFTSTCALNHLVQRSSNEWMLAGEVAAGDEILTIEGPSNVVDVTIAGEAECFDFAVDHPNHRYWGDGISSHNSGKSYIVSGNLVRNALANGVGVLLLDTEGAVKKKWATALGVDTDNPNLIRWQKNTINEVAKTISDFMCDEYIPLAGKMPREEQPPILIVVDSLGNLETETGIEQFQSGDLKGDKGIFAKQLKMMLKNTMRQIDGYQVGVVCTNHTYKSQNMYDHDDVISGGSGPIYLSDIVVNMNKLKLRGNEEPLREVDKDDDEDVKDKKKKPTPGVVGIRSKIKCVKSRYAKPFEEVEVLIPYDTGMDPYSGLFDMFRQKKMLVKDGKQWLYTSRESGKEYKLYESKIKTDTEFLEMLMREYDDSRMPIGVDETPAEAEETADVE